MAIRRTTIELDEDLVRAVRKVTGETLRATVEKGLSSIISEAEQNQEQRRNKIEEYLATALSAIDVDVLISDEAWR